jgi:hypothetical protein
MNELPLPINPGVGLQTGFVVLPLLLVAFWTWAAGVGSRFPLRARLIALAGLSIVLGVTFVLGKQPFLHNFQVFPPPVLRLFLACFVLTLVLAWSPIGRRLAESIPLAILVGFQAFRLPLEILMAKAHGEGLMPVEMSFHGRNFDVVTGVLAIPLAVMLLRGHSGRKLVYLWNFLGLALLINVVGTAVALMPGPQALLKSQIPNVWVSYSPFIWLPSILVTSAQLGHILVLRRLRAERRNANTLVA